MRNGRPPKGYVEERGRFSFRGRIQYLGEIYRSPVFSTYSAAEDWLAQFRASIGSDDVDEFLEWGAMTLEDALRRYMKFEAPEKSAKDAERRVNNLIASFPWLVERPLTDISEPHIQRFIQQRRGCNHRNTGKPVSNRTINYDIALMSRAFELARTKWGCRGLNNPTRKMKLKVDDTRVRRLSEHEEAALLEAAVAYEKGGRATVPITSIIKFGAATGMRLGETADLRWEYVDFNLKVAHLPKTKNGSKRNVALAPSTIKLLEEIKGDRSTGLVWGATYHSIENAWQEVRGKAAERAPSLLGEGDEGLDRFRFHDLRHEAVSRFFERTPLSDGEIATISGHKNQQSLWRYRHLREYLTAERLAEAERDYDEKHARKAAKQREDAQSDD